MEESQNIAFAFQDSTAAPASAHQFSRNSLSWGFSFGVGDLNFGDDRGNPMFSVSYTKALSKKTELEVSVHYIAIQSLRGIDGFVFQDSISYTHLAWQFDGTWSIRPFEEDNLWKNLQFGIGPSFRYFTGLSGSRSYRPSTRPLVVVRNPNGSLDTIASVPMTFTLTDLSQGLALGAVLKVDYFIHISKTVDFVLRTQLHSYLPALITSGTRSSFLGNSGVNWGSLGLFLRVGWE